MKKGFAVEKIGPEFFERNPVACAVDLIGAGFHWKGCTARIVETEAYQSVDDPACHTWFRPSARAFVERHAAGDAYVYLNYGVHWLFNILAKGGDGEGFVLLRAVEAMDGIDKMRKRRPGIADHLLGSGPGKLTKALGISGRDHGASFLGKKDCWIARGDQVTHVRGVRIGITKAVEFPWRFGDPDSKALSRKF